MLAAVPSWAQESTDAGSVLIVDPEATITFTGSGWGHGVGLSQWGAYSRALDGESSADILAFYYEGTSLAENYGRPLPASEPEPEPTPQPEPSAEPAVVIPVPESLESPVAVHLATVTTTTLTPQGLNRITVDGNNIAYNGQAEARVPPGTPITFTHTNNAWHIVVAGNDICGAGCPGRTAQLLFGTDTTVAVSTTGRSYAHGRFNLVADPNPTGQFALILDHLTPNKYLNNHDLPRAAPGQPTIEPPPAPESLESPVAVHLATVTTTTLTPQGLNRITVDGNNIAYNGQAEARVPPGTPITFTHTNNAWHIVVAGNDICGAGCPGRTAQLLFGTDTTVAVSTTGRSYAHGRFNLVADPNPTGQFALILDHLTPNKYLNNHDLPRAAPGQPTIEPPPAPVYPEDSIRVHLATVSSATLTPEGLNRITVDGNNIAHGSQSEARAPAGGSVTFTRHSGHWHIVVGGTDICGNGCSGHSAQMLFAEDTSVRVSATGHSYRHGRLNLVPVPNSNSQFYVVIDSLSMEQYLRGIAEIPGDWPTAALEAQVIAARTYAIATLEQRRATNTWSHPFDLYSSTWDQVYIGDSAELSPYKEPWVQTVENTAGRILLHEGAKVRAFYSSSNGGHTARGNYVFYADLAYLAAKPDSYDQQHSPHASWTRTYSVSAFNRWLGDHGDTEVGQLISMEVVDNQGASGRLDKAQIRITGTDRTITISGSRLQSRVNTAASHDGMGSAGQLLSTKFTFSVPPASFQPNLPPTDDDTTEPPTDPSEPEPPADPSPVPVDDEHFYSGTITGPDFCLNRSLGGPVTYPIDSNGDGIADTCALPSTRREAVARQDALELLAEEFPQEFQIHLAEECRAGPETFGEPEAEAADECSIFRNQQTTSEPTIEVPSTEQPDTDEDPDSPADSSSFYSGTIAGPEVCLNRSLGGPVTYPFDSDNDGIADTCALPSTRRAAVAHQRALEQLAREFDIQFRTHLANQCLLVNRTFGEPEQEATDKCALYIKLSTLTQSTHPES